MRTLDLPNPQANVAPIPNRDDLADRSVGASVTALFGAVWIAMGASALTESTLPVLAATAGIAAALVAGAVRLAPRGGEVCDDPARQFARRMRNRQFHLINGVQWAGIVALIVILNVLHRPEWIADGIIAIVGLHFLPLGRLFHSASHGVAGGALLAWSLLYPVATGAGPASPWGAVGAGVILWAFSLRMISKLAHRHG